MRPIYAENLVVAIKQEGSIEWYVLEKEYCFLDHLKLMQDFREGGYEVFEDNTFRFGIEVVNESTQKRFLDNIREYKISSEELKKMLMEETDLNEKLAFTPSVFIDFDNKVFISCFVEPSSFEAFVPDGWVGEYRDFDMDIPEAQRYWIDENGRDIIGG